MGNARDEMRGNALKTLDDADTFALFTYDDEGVKLHSSVHAPVALEFARALCDSAAMLIAEALDLREPIIEQRFKERRDGT